MIWNNANWVGVEAHSSQHNSVMLQRRHERGACGGNNADPCLRDARYGRAPGKIQMWRAGVRCDVPVRLFDGDETELGGEGEHTLRRSVPTWGSSGPEASDRV